MKVSLLTGGGDKPYALGLLSALISQGITVDFIGSDELGAAEVVSHKNVNFLNLRGDQNPNVSVLEKCVRVSRYYFRLLQYAATTDSKLFHILWTNKFPLLDRAILNFYYKLLGKKLILTAHNINEKERDGGDGMFNRFTLMALYTLVDHIFVHTNKMKVQLNKEFNIKETKVSVIPFGINNTIPCSELTKPEARDRLNLAEHDKVILFFGNIAPYKGLDGAIDALDRVRIKNDNCRLLIAGQVKSCQEHWNMIERAIEDRDLGKYVIKKIEYIPDEAVEVYFKSADVLILPYKFIYQSGVLFLSYSFGLPVIATDVGSLSEDILEGKTGMVCHADDSVDLANTILRYFDSELFRNQERTKTDIQTYGNSNHSWHEVAKITHSVYECMLMQ
ncbi:MAG: glycosyltransferase family 4 protein [Syntrophales bacterium]